jgi:hypothetical protein
MNLDRVVGPAADGAHPAGTFRMVIEWSSSGHRADDWAVTSGVVVLLGGLEHLDQPGGSA